MDDDATIMATAKTCAAILAQNIEMIQAGEKLFSDEDRHLPISSRSGTTGAPEDELYEKPKQMRQVDPRPNCDASAWMIMLRDVEYLENPSTKEATLFRRRFRVPYQFFEHLLSVVKEERWFPTRKRDVAGRPCIPVELKVMSVASPLASPRPECSIFKFKSDTYRRFVPDMLALTARITAWFLAFQT